MALSTLLAFFLTTTLAIAPLFAGDKTNNPEVMDLPLTRKLPCTISDSDPARDRQIPLEIINPTIYTLNQEDKTVSHITNGKITHDIPVDGIPTAATVKGNTVYVSIAPDLNTTIQGVIPP